MKVDSILILLSVFVTCVSFTAMIKMNKDVPEPYMDEIFHYPMTKRYFEGKEIISNRFLSLGNYTYWDSKITTFPGLYVVGNM